MATFPTADELIEALQRPNPSVETYEAARDLLAAHRFSATARAKELLSVQRDAAAAIKH
jgi:hypothetical protein